MATLYLGTRRYSSWSLRGWLGVRLAGVAAEEVVIPIAGAGSSTPAIAAISPSGTVPFLVDGDVRLPDSLAILEYCAELKPSLWPQPRTARANARAMAAEMHGGFQPMRQAMPMNLGRHAPGVGHTSGALANVARIGAMWTNALAMSGGPYLFGPDFGAVDAMYAPVVARLLTYEPPLTAVARSYCDAVRAHPLVDEWYTLAAAEPPEWRLDRYENAG